MAVSKFTGATNTIQNLSDRPNQNEGLTAAQLKLKFDQAAIDNEAYLNDVLTVEIDNLNAENMKKTGDQTIQGVKTFESSPVVPTPTSDMQASPKKYVDDKDVDRKDYIDNLDSQNVKTTGNQTVNGIKTFQEAKGNWTGLLNGEEIPSSEPGLRIRVENVEEELSDIVINVKQFGATGGSDDSVAFQEANDYLVSIGGGTLLVPRGTWYANFVIDSKIRLTGQGVNISIIKSVNGSNKDVIKGRNFDSLTGTSKATPETRGVRYMSIKDITIDGNKANNTSGYGIRIWGCSWCWENVIVQNCANDGIWTEFTTHDDPTGNIDPSSQALESDFKFIKSLGNNGNGWTYNGPHDSILNNYTAFSNTGWALYQNSGALFGSVWNSWLNGGGSYYIGDTVSVHKLTASAGYVGTGIEFKAGIGACMLSSVIVGGHPTGIIVRGSSHYITGYIRNARNADNTSGDGIVLDGAINCKISMIASGCHNFLNKITESNTNFIDGHVNIAAGKTMFSGTALSTSDYINLITVTGMTTQNILQFPSVSFNVGGWNPKFPLSNGNIITDTTVPTSTLRGGVKMQPAITNLTGAPTMGDFNNLLATLRTAGVIAP